MKPRKLFARFGIICAWIIVTFTALYLPKWHRYEEKSITIFTWGDTLDPSVLAAFEKETGIKVRLSYYATNEELQVKMQATGGEGYDLIAPSGYTVNILINEDLLKPLDRSKLHFWKDLNPILLNHPFDPNNRYSIPFEWQVYGLGVDRRFFTDKTFTPTWKSIYDPSVIDYKIAVSNDPIEAVAFGALYLYGDIENMTDEKFQDIRKLLLRQRKWVEAYTDFRADYFIATGNCPIALSTSTYIKRIHPTFPYIQFVIPEEGSFVTIENFCIPKESSKDKYVYRLLNYLYSKESMIAHRENFLFFPATLSPIEDLDLEDYEKKLLFMSEEEFKKFHFFKNIVSQKEVRKLWVEVKSF